MTPKERAAMQQALEALEDIFGKGKVDVGAITALREALEPTREGKYYYKDNACTADNADSPDCICWHDEALAEQAEQEPVAIDGLARACNLAGIDYKDFLRIKAYLPIAAPVQQVTPLLAVMDGMDATDSETVKRYAEAVHPVKQEPVAYLHQWIEYRPFGDTVVGEPMQNVTPDSTPFDESDDVTPLYAAPVRTKDLTDDEIFAFDNKAEIEPLAFARAVIAAYKEKNK